MPKIRVSKPAPEEVDQHQREYAVFTQIPGALDGQVDPEVSKEGCLGICIVGSVGSFGRAGAVICQ